jgi:hypothetical protein
MLKVLRRLFWSALLGGAAYGAYAAWQRKHEPRPDGPAEWPPISDAASPAPPVTIADGVADADDAVDLGAASGTGTSPEPDRRWVEPVEGACPPGYPIKANDNSGIYHVPGGRFYDRTVPERCYADEDAAAVDGYRRSKA